MTKDNVEKLIGDLCQLYELTPPGLITSDLEKSLIEVTKWLAWLGVLGVKPEGRISK
jgi:hypothetical protein